MMKKRWILLCLLTGLMFLFVLSGCARNKEAMKGSEMMPSEQKTTPPATTGMEEGNVMSEEIQPIQPKKLEDIFFAFDRFDLSPEARATLADNAAWLENNPGAKIVIEGNCDERGSTEYNLALGDRRAKSAYNYLINLGVSASRLSTISYGEEKPQCMEHTEACWAKNRRDHFNAK
jgi:peptidoglycan-associated lipoprotein